MFNKLKQFKDLRDQAKNLEKIMAEIEVDVEEVGIKLKINGKQEIISLQIAPNLSIPELEERLPKIFNEAVKKSQRAAAQKVQSQGGFNFPNM